MNFKAKLILSNILLWSFLDSCTKIISIEPPTNTITTSETFADSTNASSALAGIYSSMTSNGNVNFMSGSLSIYSGESSDELVPYQSSDEEFYSNSLTERFSNVYSYFWASAYQYIYQVNAAIEAIPISAGISASAKGQLVGEAKFLRSLYYFYLTNLFGDVPYITSSNYHNTSIAARTASAEIYKQIVSDLKEAQGNLPNDYGVSGGDRTRANKWAATALLARVYLYMGDWANAETQASLVINNSGLFSLNPDLNSVFLNNASGNNEAILQWYINPEGSTYNATPEGTALIPYMAPNNNPNYYISDQLLSAFEPGDLRKSAWLDSNAYGSPAITYYIPYKYKIGIVNAIPNGTPTEYIMILRLAEQYLIRAEARAQQNINPTGAITDLDTIRERAGLSDLSPSLTQPQILAAIAQERRIELFAEWGHRWLDLKRTRQVDAVMNIATPLKGQGTQWQSYQQLYPIPFPELSADPNLTQNPKY